jgi:hypothetical protein
VPGISFDTSLSNTRRSVFRIRVAAANRITANARWPTKLSRTIYLCVVGHGYYPLLAGLWLAAVVFAGTMMVALNLNDFIPTNSAAATQAATAYAQQTHNAMPTQITAQTPVRRPSELPLPQPVLLHIVGPCADGRSDSRCLDDPLGGHAVANDRASAHQTDCLGPDRAAACRCHRTAQTQLMRAARRPIVRHRLVPQARGARVSSAIPTLPSDTWRPQRNDLAKIQPLRVSPGRLSRFAADTGDMPIEETIWDVVVPNDVHPRQHDLPTVLADLITQRLPADKKLLAVVGWSANGGCLFQSRPGVQRYAVSYRVQAA